MPLRAGQPDLTKPPVYYWMECAFARLWHGVRYGGSSEPAWISPWLARLPAVLLAIALVAMVVFLTARTEGTFASLCAGLALVGAPFAVTGLIEANIDGPFAVSVSAAFVAYFCMTMRDRGRLPAFLAWTGFTTLSLYFKGPVYFQFFLPLMAGVVGYQVYRDFRAGKTARSIVAASLRILVVSLLGLLISAALFLLYYWLLSQAPTIHSRGGWSYLGDYFRGEVLDNSYGEKPDHGAPVYQIFVLLLGGATLPLILTFTIGITGLTSFLQRRKRAADEDLPLPEASPPPRSERERAWRAFLWIWLLGGFLVLSLTPAKQYRYTLPLLPPLAILAAMAIREFLRSGRPAAFSVLLPILLVCGSLASAALITYAVLIRLRHLAAMYGSALSVEGSFDFLLLGLWLVLVAVSAAFLFRLARGRGRRTGSLPDRRQLVVLLLVSALLASVGGNMVRVSQQKTVAPRYLALSILGIPGLGEVATYRCANWLIWHAFRTTSLPSVVTSSHLRRYMDEAGTVAIILRPSAFRYRLVPGEGLEILILHAGQRGERGAGQGYAGEPEGNWRRTKLSDNGLDPPQAARVRFVGADGEISEPMARLWTVHSSMPSFGLSRVYTVLANYEMSLRGRDQEATGRD
ncbi:MAG: hypothetical protein HQ559_13755 [Lentisphaerae bacterium]|nr:hypothetical protein [Lentisphaerota bacterium]